MNRLKSSQELLQEERDYSFSHFSHSMALSLANKLVKQVISQALRAVTIEIYYQGETILHYKMDGRQASDWPRRKIQTVLDSQHSSLYVFSQSKQGEAYQDWQENPDYAVCGGAFPIIVKGQMLGVIAVSGLEHYADHDLIIEALGDLQED